MAGTGEENLVADPAGQGAAVYGELHEPARVAGTVSTATELRPYRRSAGFHYPWLEDFLTWLEAKEARSEYHAWLEHTTPWAERSTLVADEYLRSPEIAPPDRTFAAQEWMYSPRFEDRDITRYAVRKAPSSASDLVDVLLSQPQRAT